jgi:hypothetical protein
MHVIAEQNEDEMAKYGSGLNREIVAAVNKGYNLGALFNSGNKKTDQIKKLEPRTN